MDILKAVELVQKFGNRALAAVCATAIVTLFAVTEKEWKEAPITNGIFVLVVFSLFLLAANAVKWELDRWASNRGKFFQHVSLLSDLELTERRVLAAFIVQGEGYVYWEPDPAFDRLVGRGCLIVLNRGRQSDVQRYELAGWVHDVIQKRPDLLRGEDGRGVVRVSRDRVERESDYVDFAGIDDEPPAK